LLAAVSLPHPAGVSANLPMRVLLVTPPMTQLNTPYPAVPYLMGTLGLHRERLGLELRQADLSLELFLALFQRSSIVALGESLQANFAPGRRGRRDRSPAVAAFLADPNRYADAVDPAIRFLQGREPSLALRIVGREFLPEGPRFATLDDDEGELLHWAFGTLGLQDRARYLCSLFVDDLADVLRDGVDPRFELARYGERLASSAPSFDPLRDALQAPPTFIDRALDELTARLLREAEPDVVAVTAPFPGNVYGAFRVAQQARLLLPNATLVLGGGWVNTELRGLRDARVFDWWDAICLDDGERPLLSVLERRRAGVGALRRTMLRVGDRVSLEDDPTQRDLAQAELGTPSYAGLPLDRYPSVVEMLNPMHRLWSDGRWNKLTVAHGCYWKRCTFCDVGLDYIGRYDALGAVVIVDRMEALARETGTSGFHFVDEAAPPRGLRALAHEILRRGLTCTWWGNIRFEKAFDADLCALLARSGCVAVSGGLEVAGDRILALMDKGVTVGQVARVTRAFTDAGIMVHAYLMYGFPTQTEQETVDSLERVRQLFRAGCLQSAFWHRFAATVHSPIGQDPARFGITIEPPPALGFAQNDLPFHDPTGCDHDALAEGLRRAVYNYMMGLGLDDDVRRWFRPEREVPKARVAKGWIQKELSGQGG
jgi:hypothetical protein